MRKEAEKTHAILAAYAKTAKEAQENEKKLREQLQALKNENRDLKTKVRRIIDTLEANGRYLRADCSPRNTDKENVSAANLLETKAMATKPRAVSPKVPCTSRSPILVKNVKVVAGSQSPRGAVSDLIKGIITTLSAV